MDILIMVQQSFTHLKLVCHIIILNSSTFETAIIINHATTFGAVDVSSSIIISITLLILT